MVDFTKFGFSIKEVDGKKQDDADTAHYESEHLEIQHWKKPDVYVVAIRRERLIEWKSDFYTEEQAKTLRRPNTGDYVVKEGISESERRMAQMLMSGNFHVYPLYIGAIKGETFFEILINSVCTDADKLIQCGS